MRRVIQWYKDGSLEIVDVPVPHVGPNEVLVRTRASVLSAGTEKYMVELAKKSLLGKARERPDLLRAVMAKARTEGPMEAWRQARSRLDTPVPLGYSAAGIVVETGAAIADLVAGDRVACAGSGYAGHAELQAVPRNLVARIPDGVDFESAAFVALGGIALEAVRMAQVSLGHTVVVIGLGLLGQIAVQLLNAAGCHVIGMDIDPQKAEMARQHCAEAVATDPHQLSAICRQGTAGHGADAVVILAATPSNEPLERAAELCRERGRIVAAGLVGLEIPRKPFYDKELELVVSRAWGPGLYDPRYIEKGLDYPIAHARWTARRNIEEFVAQLAKGVVQVKHLVSHRFPFDRALEAYELILEEKEPYIGVLLTYAEESDLRRRIELPGLSLRERGRKHHPQPGIGIALIGAGQFATGTLLPPMRDLKGVYLRGVATSTGLSGRHTADKFGFDYCTTDYREILDDPEVSLVFILTRHGSHAHLVTEALKAGKHVFVEKPLALNRGQLREVVYAYQQQIPNSPFIFVGFNRRFSPFTKWLKDQFASVTQPLAVHCTVNAGLVPLDHWLHDQDQGGGRIIGEVCHFVDLIQSLTGSLPVRVYAETLVSSGFQPSDNVVITLKMANGSIGSITYVSGGDKRYLRERVEILGGGGVGVIENFRAATFTRGGRMSRKRNWLTVDRGHRGEIKALLDALTAGASPPVAFEEYVYATLATFAIEEAMRTGIPASVDLETLELSDFQARLGRDLTGHVQPKS